MGVLWGERWRVERLRRLKCTLYKEATRFEAILTFGSPRRNEQVDLLRQDGLYQKLPPEPVSLRLHYQRDTSTCGESAVNFLFPYFRLFFQRVLCV